MQEGSSYYNFGPAVDFCLIIDGIIKDYDRNTKADRMEVMTIFNKYGLGWSGGWKSIKDIPYFSKIFGKTISQMKAMQKGATGYQEPDSLRCDLYSSTNFWTN